MIRSNGDRNKSIEAIKRAIDVAGSPTSLAKKMGVSKQLVYYWKLKGLPPYIFANKIFLATAGKIGIEEICPQYEVLTHETKKLIIRIYRRRKPHKKTAVVFKLV